LVFSKLGKSRRETVEILTKEERAANPSGRPPDPDFRTRHRLRRQLQA